MKSNDTPTPADVAGKMTNGEAATFLDQFKVTCVFDIPDDALPQIRTALGMGATALRSAPPAPGNGAAEMREAAAKVADGYGDRLVGEQIRALPAPEVPAPVAGEDEALLNHLDMFGTHYRTNDRDHELAQTMTVAAARLRTLLADVALLKEAFDAEEERADMHANLNRRAAEALGKPQQGERSSWHDIPEEITALRARAEAAEETEREACAVIAEKGSVLGSKRMGDPALVDAWMSGVVDTQVQTAAAIRARAEGGE